MPNKFTDTVENKLKELAEKNSYYIYICLRKFAIENLSAIAAVCKNLYFENDVIEKIQLAYIDELKKLNFIKAYVSHELKTTGNGSDEICKNSLASFISNQNSILTEAESFALNQLNGLTNNTETLLNTIDDIKMAIIKYDKPNKQAFVAEFNHELDTFKNKILAKPFHVDKEEVKNNLTNQINELQTKQDAYYTGLKFFSQRRKNNSTLQPKIDEAKRLLNKPASI